MALPGIIQELVDQAFGELDLWGEDDLETEELQRDEGSAKRKEEPDSVS